MSAVTITISKSGKKLPPSFQVITLEISREFNRLPMARVVLLDGDLSNQQFELADNDFFEPGSEISISLRHEEVSSKDTVVFAGIVLSQTVSADRGGFLLTVEMKHKAFNLTTTRKNALFLDKSDDDVVATVLKASGVSVSGSIGASYVHKQLVQYASTDWDFALSRIEANGGVILLKDDGIMLKAIKDLGSGGKSYKITAGIDEIFSLELEADASAQLSSVKTTAWDIKKQALLPDQASESFETSFGNLKGKAVADKIKVKENLLINTADITDKEAKSWANATLVKSRMSLFRGRIHIKGRADILPGATIEIEGLGKRFKGKALAGGISHYVNEQGWTTEIFLGLSPVWFAEQNDNIMVKPASGLLPPVHGLVIGIVDKFKADPDKNFRVRVKVPAFKGDKDVVLWARLATFYAGKDRGNFFFPEEGDEVVLGFFNDDPRQAVIVGSLFSSAQAIPGALKSDEKNLDKGIVMKNGAQLRFKDDKKSLIELKTPGNNSIVIDDEKKQIVIKDQNGNTVEMSDKGITIKSAKDLKLEASGNVTIKGAKVEVQ